MLASIVFAVCVALSRSESCTTIPHGSQLKTMVDSGFNLMDTDKNGHLDTNEMNAVWQHEDMNHDGTLTLEEYAAAWNTTPEILAPIFNVWDQDGDDRVSATYLSKYSHLMDPNGDGQITLHEYEHYMTGTEKDLCDLLANNVGPDQTAWMRMLIWAHAIRNGLNIPEDTFSRDAAQLYNYYCDGIIT